MNGSLRIGRVRGIPVGIHWSLAVFAFFIATNLAGYFFPSFAPGHADLTYLVAGVGAAVLLAASILAHELGHALMGRRHGVGTEDITLWLLGGVARLRREASTPRAAFEIAVAGPAVSVALAVVVGVAALAGAVFALPALLVTLLAYLAVVNVFLGLFNMLPALPLDGGRALQAWKWHKGGDREVATVEAAQLGRALGWGLVGVGLLQLVAGAGNGLWTALIGGFVIAQAGRERRRAQRIIAARTRRHDPMAVWRQLVAMGFVPRPPAPTAAQADLVVIDPEDPEHRNR